MINKIKYICIVAIITGILGGVSNNFAQTINGGKVLVTADGKTLRQSDVDELIRFYEWTFQTEFTSAQRTEFRRIKETQFRSDPINEEKGNRMLKGYLPQIQEKSSVEQERIRLGFNKSFISDLRQGTKDAEAKFLISVYDGANGGENNAVNQLNEQNETDDSSFGGDLSSFIGKWVWQNSGSGSWNTMTGAYMGGSGTRVTYQFSANGEVVYSGIMNTMTGGCSQQVFLSQKGRASLNINTMTIKWSPGTSTRDYSCDKAGNYTKNVAGLTETFPVAFKTNSTGQKLLCLTSGGKETCYSPTR